MGDLRVAADAFAYLDRIRAEFPDRPHACNEFLRTMKMFKSQQIDTIAAMERVSRLFRGKKELLLGFNIFLPEGCEIEPSITERDSSAPPFAVQIATPANDPEAEEDCPSIVADADRRQPQPSLASSTLATSHPPPPGYSKPNVTFSSSSSSSTSVSSSFRNDDEDSSDNCDGNDVNGNDDDLERHTMDRTKLCTEEDALLYLDQQVKVEFCDQQHVYNDFLNVMKKFKSGQIDATGVMELLSNLFRGKRRLLLRFRSLLPDRYKTEIPPSDADVNGHINGYGDGDGDGDGTDPTAADVGGDPGGLYRPDGVKTPQEKDQQQQQHLFTSSLPMRNAPTPPSPCPTPASPSTCNDSNLNDNAKACAIDDDTTAGDCYFDTVGRGYVLLDECTVAVTSNDANGEVKKGEWLDVPTPPPSGIDDETRKTKTNRKGLAASAASSSAMSGHQAQRSKVDPPVAFGGIASPADRKQSEIGVGIRCCPRCTLAFAQELPSRPSFGLGATSKLRPSCGLSIDPNYVPRFNGTLADAKGGGTGSSVLDRGNSDGAEGIRDGMHGGGGNRHEATEGEGNGGATATTLQGLDACVPRCPTSPGANRSDASLLLGLTLWCRDMGFVQIDALRVLLFSDDEEERGKQQCKGADDPCRTGTPITVAPTAGQDPTRWLPNTYRAALLVTVSVAPPPLHPPPKKRARLLSSLPGRKGILPPSVQLMHALLQCDFDRLQGRMDNIQRLNALKTPSNCRIQRATTRRGNGSNISLFTHDLSLEEVYKRIPGACSDGNANFTDTNDGWLRATKASSSSPSLNHLPDEIFINCVVPYLRAKSLNSLCGTSKRVKRRLRAVVPGLKLRLFRHQVASLEWMRRREGAGDSTEDDFPRMEGSANNNFAEDFHGASSGGASVLLLSPPRSAVAGGGPSAEKRTFVRIDGRTGRPVSPAPNSSVGRVVKIAPRGGLLCDDPGLGKTVTVLSLVLQTFGQSTDRNASSETNDDELDDERLFRLCWQGWLTSLSRREKLGRLVNTLRRSDDDSDYFELPVVPNRDGCPDYNDIVKTPICMKDVLNKIGCDGYDDNFEGMCSDVFLCYSNAMQYHPPEHHIHESARRLSRRFKKYVAHLKAETIASGKRDYLMSSANPDRSVAAILVEKAHRKFLNSLRPSSATLLIVPNVLLKHWQDQFEMHIDFKYCTGKIPLVFHHRPDADLSEDDAFYLCTVARTHFPLLFVDEVVANNPLPCRKFLAMFRVVLTTSQRTVSEWKYGSSSSSLVKVHWLRLVVDEGHSMGRGMHSNSIQFASWITAQRRWAMTGTPSQQTASENGLRNILGLMRFLKNEFFAAKLGGDQAWKELINQPWNEGHLVSFFRLQSLLSLFMVRHTKHDIEEIPLPQFVRTYTEMSGKETVAYNTLVSSVQMNIKTTSMKGKSSGWQDSLLNPRQSRHATLALQNIRLACCGGTYILPRLKEKNRKETLSSLKHKHHCDEVKVSLVGNYLHRATNGELSSCMLCGLQLQTLFVMTCGDMVCTECFTSDANSCPVCDKEFDVDEFQRLQPGMICEWKLSLKDEEEQREKEALLRSERANTTYGDIGGGADHANDDGRGAFHPNGAGNNRQRSNEDRRRPRRRRGRKANHQCVFSRRSADGKCLSCQEEHFDCNFISDVSQCSICHKFAEECPSHASKSFHVTNKLLNLLSSESSSSTTTSRPLKVIIFSQFRQLLNYVGDRLIRRFGGSCVAEYWGTAKRQELQKFSKSPSCFCLLLGKDGSHGLDLSFVTNIILLDELWDKSLENQVVARAYRMGATGPVEVEKLVARDSIEEVMSRLNQGMSSNVQKCAKDVIGDEADDSTLNRRIGRTTSSSHGGNLKERQQAKLHYLLRNVALIRKFGMDDSENVSL